MGNRNLYFIFISIFFLNACAMDVGGPVNDNCPACPVGDAGVNNNNNVDPGDLDRDDDGFTPNQGDCNDENPVVYPDAPELCDGHDNDCDGLVDEGCGGCESGMSRPCGTDVGVCQAGVQVCTDGVWGDQCLGQVGPQTEVCGNGLDDNCNGLVDEGCTIDPGDLDQDGDGYTPNQGDCNDANPNVHPGTPEVCGNGLDDNCNGLVDEGCTVPVDADGDGYTTATDCDDSNAAVYPGAPEMCDGLDNDCDGQVDEGCPACPSLTLARYGDEVWLSGERATDFHLMEFWTNDSRGNLWVTGIQTGNMVVFPVPAEVGYNWFMPRTGASSDSPGSVLFVPDPCVQFTLNTFLCNVDVQSEPACPSLLSCNLGGDACPPPE